MSKRLGVILAGLLIAACAAPRAATNQGAAAQAPRERASTEATEGSGLVTKLAAAGVDFYARGHEPEWALDMDFQSGMRFSTLAGVVLHTPPVPGVRAQDADVMRYHAETEAGNLTVTVSGEECTDGMSGETFTHRVRVEIQRSIDAEPRTFTGCGRTVADPRLAGTWELAELNGAAVDASKLPKGAPTLELRLAEGRCGGNGGCNRFLGDVTVQLQAIHFGQMAATMMACPDMAIERAFVGALSGRQLEYTLAGAGLVLTGPDGTRLRFQKQE